MAHLLYKYVQSNQSNTRDRKTFATRANFFSSILFSFSPRVYFLSTEQKVYGFTIGLSYTVQTLKSLSYVAYIQLITPKR